MIFDLRMTVCLTFDVTQEHSHICHRVRKNISYILDRLGGIVIYM